MEKTAIALNESDRGEIQLFSGDKKVGKMDISITGNLLTVYHTEVDEAYNGKGYAKLLLEKLVGKTSLKKWVPILP